LLSNEFQNYFPNKTTSEINALVKVAKRQIDSDPLAIPNLKSQLMLAVGGNLELTTFLCSAFSAYPYTDRKGQWIELKSCSDDLSQTWSPLTKAFQSLTFNFLDSADVEFASNLRNDGRLQGLRGFLRKTWNGVKSHDTWSSESARAYADELRSQHDAATVEWNKINQEVVKWAGTAVAGFATGSSTLCLGHLEIAVPSYGIFFKSAMELASILMKRTDFVKQFPASVFMDLEKSSKHHK
jgi:hypothetical protein